MGVRISTGRRASALLAIFLCIELLDEVVDGLMGAAWPLIRHDLALSYVEIGLLLTVPSLVAHVVEPAVGLLADGKRRFAAIALGGCAFATAMILVAGATSFLYVLAALVVFYPASGTFVSLSQSSLMDLRPDDEERNMVLWTVAGGLGVALGPILLGFALWADGSWRDVFLVVGALSLGATVAVWLLRPRRAFVDEDDDEPHVLRRAWHAAKDPVILKWLFLLATVDMLLEVFVSFLTLYFVDEVGAKPAVAAAILSAWTIAALVGEAALIVVLRYVGGLKVLRTTTVLVGGLLPLFFFVPGVTVKAVIIASVGLFSAGWYAITKAQFFKELAGKTGIAMALSSVFGVVQGFVPAGVGWIAETYGLQTALLGVVVVPIVLGVGVSSRWSTG